MSFPYHLNALSYHLASRIWIRSGQAAYDSSSLGRCATERIFERFFRVDESRARSSGEEGAVASAGLGLAIARLTAEAHGGTVYLDATGPGGTRFVVTLPVSPHDCE
jgi:signal transduction histidine kinase